MCHRKNYNMKQCFYLPREPVNMRRKMEDFRFSAIVLIFLNLSPSKSSQFHQSMDMLNKSINSIIKFITLRNTAYVVLLFYNGLYGKKTPNPQKTQHLLFYRCFSLKIAFFVPKILFHVHVRAHMMWNLNNCLSGIYLTCCYINNQ